MDVLTDITRLREFRESERLRAAEDRLDAVGELAQRGIPFENVAFLKALEDGDQQCVDLFVRAGINIHTNDARGSPPIIMALKKGYTIIAHILLTAGADPNARDSTGLTPLLLAWGKTTQGYQSIAEKLIQMGADVNARDRLGWTPLLLALSGGTEGVIELLIERGSGRQSAHPPRRQRADLGGKGRAYRSPDVIGGVPQSHQPGDRVGVLSCMRWRLPQALSAQATMMQQPPRSAGLRQTRLSDSRRP